MRHFRACIGSFQLGLDYLNGLRPQDIRYDAFEVLLHLAM